MNFVLKLDETQVKRVMTFYRDYIAESKNGSVLFFAKTKYMSVTIYSSFKVMFQGQDAEQEYKMWCQMLEITPEDNANKSITKTSKPVSRKEYFITSIGSDEVGTGDFFGPITVCAAYVSEENIAFLKGLGIDDSKKITDEKIRVIGEQLKDRIPYSMLALHNDKFNEMTNRGYNMNKLKAYLHNSAIISLISKLGHTPKVIVDQFADGPLYFRYLQDESNVFKDITFTTKAESKYASVAVGSIIARYAFLQFFDLLSETCGYSLLKGANGHVDQLAANIIKEKGESFLYNIAKMNFKTLQKAKDLL